MVNSGLQIFCIAALGHCEKGIISYNNNIGAGVILVPSSFGFWPNRTSWVCSAPYAVDIYRLDFDKKFAPPSCLVEAFRGESCQVDGVVFRCFEVVDPSVYFGQDFRASSW